MATEKKKTLQEQASSAGQTYSEELLNNAAMADAYQSELNVQKANYLNNVAQAQEAANAEAIETAQEAQKVNYQNGLDQILDMGNRIKLAEQEAEEAKQANYRAAKWTGATELAASLANLFTVGMGNAVSQQYHDFSQDWMKRADMNAREHRARIDNLRERQRVLQDRLNILKSGDVNALAEMRMKANEARAKTQAEAGKSMFDAISKGADASIKARNEAAKAQYDADLAGIRIAASGRRASSGGATRSGSSKAASGTTTTKTTDPRKVSGEPYHITSGGKEYIAKMSKQARKQAFIDGTDELKEDVYKIAGANSWEELEAGITGKKAKYKEYYDIVTAIQDGDTDAIDYWYSTHRKQCERMGEFFLGIANGYWEKGGDEEVNGTPEEPETEEPEEEYTGSDGENFDFGDKPMPELNKPKKNTKKDSTAKTSGSWDAKYK